MNGECSKYIFAGKNRIAIKKATDTYYYHRDHLGSSSVVTDASGNKVEEIHYLPFGSTLSDTGSVSVNHKFTSQELDAETDLYYYGARYYNPVLGRFISPDSIVPDPANPQAFNRYSYVINRGTLKKYVNKLKAVYPLAGSRLYLEPRNSLTGKVNVLFVNFRTS